MADIIITKSRRGLFNTEEWETFAGVNGQGPVDTRVFFRCRQPSCWRIWTMEQSAYRVIDIESNPIQCAECGSYNVTATWCNVNERPYTYIGFDSDANIDLSEIKEYFSDLKEYRDNHGGSDPDHSSTLFLNAAWNIWIDYTKIGTNWTINGESVPYPYDQQQYFEVFHRFLPTVLDTAFYTGTGKATKWSEQEIQERVYTPIDNKNFYRCIINMVIQTEHVPATGGTGGSA